MGLRKIYNHRAFFKLRAEEPVGNFRFVVGPKHGAFWRPAPLPPAQRAAGWRAG